MVASTGKPWRTAIEPPASSRRHTGIEESADRLPGPAGDRRTAFAFLTGEGRTANACEHPSGAGANTVVSSSRTPCSFHAVSTKKNLAALTARVEHDLSDRAQTYLRRAQENANEILHAIHFLREQRVKRDKLAVIGAIKGIARRREGSAWHHGVGMLHSPRP